MIMRHNMVQRRVVEIIGNMKIFDNKKLGIIM
jgi:hypothetical protein